MSSQVQKHFDASKVAKGIQVMSFERVSELGAARILAGDLTINPPNTNDCAIIMYTSGSTGKPKGNNCSSQCKAGSDILKYMNTSSLYMKYFSFSGVMLSHCNLISAMSSLINIAQFKPNDRYIGYLPLAHVLELLAETSCLLYGIKVGYRYGNDVQT